MEYVTIKIPVPGWRDKPLIALLIFFGLMCLLNFLLAWFFDVVRPPPSWSAFWVFLALGLIGAQINIGLTWLVFGPTELIARLILVLSAGGLLIGAALIGHHFFSRFFPNDFGWLPGFPVGVLLATAPMLFQKYFFRWQFYLKEDTPDEVSSTNFSIQDLVIYTILAALSVAMTRFEVGLNPEMFWIAIVVGGIFGVAQLILVPTMLYLMKDGRTSGSFWGASLVLAFGLVALFNLISMSITFAQNRRAIRFMFQILVSGSILLTATLTWCWFLFQLKHLGVRMKKIGRAEPTPVADKSDLDVADPFDPLLD